VAAAIERIVHYAGWTDKYEQILGSVNPVASAHFNFTVTEPMGIIGIIAPDEAPVLGLLSLILPAITSGNSVVALASTTQPYPSILLGEMLATSDLPGGVVNLLTGVRSELIPTFATHEHLRASAVSRMRRGAQSAAPRRGRKREARASAQGRGAHRLVRGQDAGRGGDPRAAGVQDDVCWHPVGFVLLDCVPICLSLRLNQRCEQSI
jgi:acyl-CoA reductase-like NAD-dependent aldehyde dehydrogenase